MPKQAAPVRLTTSVPSGKRPRAARGGPPALGGPGPQPRAEHAADVDGEELSRVAAHGRARLREARPRQFPGKPEEALRDRGEPWRHEHDCAEGSDAGPPPRRSA